MKTKRKFFQILFMSFFLSFNLSFSANKVIITDNVGRSIELEVPIKTAAVTLRYNNELIRACGAIDKVIGVDLNTAQDKVYWSNFSNSPIIGRSQKELNYEEIINLSPDVLIIPSNGTYKEAITKLEPFGIKVIVISGYDTDDFHNQVKNIGLIFGKEKEAKEFIEFYDKPLNYIKETLKDKEKRTIYWEDAKDYYTAFPNSYYFNMIEASGGENIFGDVSIKTTESQVDSEKIISANPSVIVKNISPKFAIKGTGVHEPPLLDQRTSTINDIKSRTGWEEISAVKNNKVYLMSQFGHGGASKMIGAVYMAKWLYPDILTELDPNELFRLWLEKYQGMPYVEGHFYPLPLEDK